MNFTLKIWRQPNRSSPGRMVKYSIKNISDDTSFLEMMDILNDELVRKGEDPVAFDSDCREGICGSCGFMVSGIPHGPKPATTVCQLFMRHFKDGDVITCEPWRAKGFPVIKDLVVDRSAFDRIMASGGYVSVDAGGAPDANSIAISKTIADCAFDAAECVGCGACVAACKNASASLFVSAKVTQMALLPQGHPERERRVFGMVAQMQKEGFGGCSNEGECEAVCPKEISTKHISKMIREYVRATVKSVH